MGLMLYKHCSLQFIGRWWGLGGGTDRGGGVELRQRAAELARNESRRRR